MKKIVVAFGLISGALVLALVSAGVLSRRRKAPLGEDGTMAGARAST
jgi:uncharacterized protein (TIGR03382 family)